MNRRAGRTAGEPPDNRAPAESAQAELARLKADAAKLRADAQLRESKFRQLKVDVERSASEFRRQREADARGTSALREKLEEGRRTRLALLNVLEDTAREHELARHARKQWVDTVDALRMPIMVHDEQFRIVRANRAYTALAGLDFADLIGRPYWECFPKRDGPLPNCLGYAGKPDSSAAPQGEAEELVLPSGAIFMSHSFPLHDASGRLVHGLHVFEDVTERRRQEAQLRLMALVVDHSPAILFRWRPMPGWPVAYVSGNVAQWGYTVEQLTSGALPYARLVHPDDLERIAREVDEYTRQGLVQFQQEYRIFTADGDIRWVEDRTTVERDASGAVSHFQGIVLDISERKRAEMETAAHLARVRTHLDGIATLSRSEALLAGDVERLARDVTELVSRVTGVERANVWLFNAGETELRCIDLFEATPGSHTAGMVLTEAEFRNEFAALKSARYVNADDPLTDPRTAGYVGTYLKPLRITSMLDAVVQISDRHLGLLCLEHVDRPHHWEPDEIAFACQLADNIALAVVNRERRELQTALMTNEQKLRDIVEHSTNLYYSHTADHVLTYVSPQSRQFFDCEPDELRFRWQELLTGNPLNRKGIEATQRAIDTGQAQFPYELELKGKRGRLIWVEVNEAPVVRDGRTIAMVGALTDITERKHAESRLLRAHRALRTLSAGNEALMRAEDELSLLQTMCNVVVDTGGYRCCFVGYARDDERKSVTPMAAAGSPLARMLQIPFSWAEEGEGRGAIGNAIRTGTAQVLRDVTENPLLGHIHDYAREMGIATVLALPLFVGTDKRPLGVIVVMSMERGAFDDEEMRLLQELANDLAYGILTLRTRAERGIATEKLRTSLEESIQAIAATVEMRDPYTAGHQQRVAQLAAAIGREMGLDEERIHGLHLAGIVHDLGKISVPAEILSKPGRLTELELGLVREHARSGHEILKGIDFPWPIARMVLEHHERLDGSGYPQGLKGDAILPESRILTVADVVEAMSSHRPYRPGLGVDRALAEIETNRGRLYDAEAADACLRLFRERRFSFR